MKKGLYQQDMYGCVKSKQFSVCSYTIGILIYIQSKLSVRDEKLQHFDIHLEIQQQKN